MRAWCAEAAAEKAAKAAAERAAEIDYARSMEAMGQVCVCARVLLCRLPFFQVSSPCVYV